MASARLARDVALVTGATGGAGLVIAERLASEGAVVAVHGRNQDAIESTVDHLRNQGFVASGFAADLSAGAQACIDLVASVEAEFGPISVLVNNAADQRLTPLSGEAVDAWHAIFEVNVIAVAELCRLVANAGDGSARMVLIGSVEGLSPFPGHAAYAASKAAVCSLTASLATELAPARINAVLPGLIDRKGLAQAWPVGWNWWCATAPLGRPVLAEEVASAVLFLASQESSGITGASLVVDAGWSSSARAPW